MKTKIIDFEKLPDIIEFEGQFMRLYKRSKNVAMVEYLYAGYPIKYAVGRIYRTYVELPNGKIVDAKEQFLLIDMYGFQITWLYNDFHQAIAEYKKLVKIYN